MDQANTFKSRWTRYRLLGSLLVLLGCALATAREASKPADLDRTYTDQVRPMLSQYCLKCHSTKKHKGDLDLPKGVDRKRSDARLGLLADADTEFQSLHPGDSPGSHQVATLPCM